MLVQKKKKDEEIQTQCFNNTHFDELSEGSHALISKLFVAKIHLCFDSI